jgi:TolB-like protein
MEADEEATARTLSTCQETIEGLVAGHHGRVFGRAGDSVIAEFASPVEAVRCAVDIQRELEARNVDLPEDRRMRLRIGVNLGDVMVEGDNLLGDGVNIAARLETLAEPGGISLARSVFDQVKKQLDLGYEYLGEHEVKNIAEPVQVYRVLTEPEATGKVIGEPKRAAQSWKRMALAAVVFVLIGVAGAVTWLRPWEPTIEPASVERMAFPLPDRPSIAVLPFTNMSDDPGQVYFADGMTDDLITDLSKVSGLFVIARNSVFAYKDKPVKIRQVAEELGVRYVLEGSVRRAGDDVRINAQLIVDATTGGHIWAERYDGSLDNIFAVQDKFVRRIVKALALNLSPEEQEEIDRGQTSNIEAREAFQRGWEHYLRFSPEQNARAATELKTAIELDPDYGRAYAALGLVYLRGCAWRWNEPLNMSTSGAFDTAAGYLDEAKTHPSSLANVAASQIYLYDERHDEALVEAARAIALDPNDPEAHIGMAWTMITAGNGVIRHERAEKGGGRLRKGPRARPRCHGACASPGRDIRAPRAEGRRTRVAAAVETGGEPARADLCR